MEENTLPSRIERMGFSDSREVISSGQADTQQTDELCGDLQPKITGL